MIYLFSSSLWHDFCSVYSYLQTSLVFLMPEGPPDAYRSSCFMNESHTLHSFEKLKRTYICEKKIILSGFPASVSCLSLFFHTPYSAEVFCRLSWSIPTRVVPFFFPVHPKPWSVWQGKRRPRSNHLIIQARVFSELLPICVLGHTSPSSNIVVFCFSCLGTHTIDRL